MSPIDRIYIIVGCVLIVALAATIALCKLIPGCWGQEVCFWYAKERKPKQKQEHDSEVEELVSSMEEPLDVSIEKGDNYRTALDMYSGAQFLLPNFKSQTYTELDDPYSAREKERLVPKDGTPSGEEKVVSPDLRFLFYRGEIHFSLKYDSLRKQLIVRVSQARQLLFPTAFSPTEVIIKVFLYDRKYLDAMADPKKSKVRPSDFTPAFELVGGAMKDTINPLFKETFNVAMAKAKVKGHCLKIVSCGYHSNYKTDMTHGEVLVDLSTLDLFREKYFCEDLKVPRMDCQGRVTVGLSYMPTSEKLQVFIQRLKDVPAEKSENSKIYVKLNLLHKGKDSGKKRTRFYELSSDIEIQEILQFDIPRALMLEINLLLTAKLVMKSSVSEEQVTTRGRAIIGASGMPEGRKQWEKMLQTPRKIFTKEITLI